MYVHPWDPRERPLKNSWSIQLQWMFEYYNKQSYRSLRWIFNNFQIDLFPFQHFKACIIGHHYMGCHSYALCGTNFFKFFIQEIFIAAIRLSLIIFLPFIMYVIVCWYLNLSHRSRRAITEEILSHGIRVFTILIIFTNYRWVPI